MKRNTISKSGLAYLIVGLLFTTCTPIANRYFPISDLVQGFLTGLGLMLEVIAIVKIQRSKRTQKCTAWNS